MSDNKMNPNLNRHDQAVHAAWLYHERGLNQQSVADRLGVSRSTVSRLLSLAERTGIVKVVVTEPLPESAMLAEALVDRFGLAAATVEIGLPSDQPRQTAARAMARRIEHLATIGPTTIAAGWGRTLGLAAQQLRQTPTTDVLIVDAFGHTTNDNIAPAVEVTNTLASKLGARVMHLPSPGFATTAEIAASFYASEPVAAALGVARAAEATMVSIGVIGDDSLLVQAGYLTEDEMTAIIEGGAVGEIFGMYFNASGEPVSSGPPYQISLSLDDLKRSKRVVAAAGGADKRAAVLGAIAAGAIDELAVDDSLANAMLSDDDAESDSPNPPR